MKGFYNKLLRVDLTNQTYNVEKIDDEVLKNNFGGKGLGTYLLNKNVKSGIDPLSKENKLIITIGPATDTIIPGASRYGVYSKSPLTGIYGESVSGGYVAPAIKKTGYDAIIFEGASKSSVYVEISDKNIFFHDANHLSGKDTYFTEETVLKEINNPSAQAIVIGPAGENLVRFACIVNNKWRCAGRVGMGAVMGFKKLKAVVFHGESHCEIADTDMLKEYVKSLHQKAKFDAIVKAYQLYGTPMQVAVTNKFNTFPTRYWSAGYYENWENLSADYMRKNMGAKPKACYRCFLACGKLNKIKKGRYAGLTIEGPEYETIYAIGGLNCLSSLEEVAYLNDICDRLGMDTMTAGNLASFTIEAIKKGKVKRNLDYGDTEGIAALFYEISNRNGEIGDILANGIKYASKKWDMEHEAVHVKGLEPSGFDPRVLKGMGLAYATSTRGACHLRATFYKLELSGAIDPDKIIGKAEVFVELEDRMTIFDTMILCRFFRDLIDWDGLITIISLTTGITMNQSELKNIANNIITATREFNTNEGLTRKDDTLPKRFFETKLPETGKIINKSDFDKMVDDYYSLRGWK